MKLYGVMHGQEFHMAGIPMGKFDALPNEEILQAVRELPPKSVVGIEFFRELAVPGKPLPMSFDVDGITYNFSERNDQWEGVRQVAEEHGHRVVYLDELALFMEHAHVLHKVMYGEKKDGRQNLLWRETPEERDYFLQTYADYVFLNRRHEAITSNIIRYRPNIVVVGAGHGDEFMIHPEQLDGIPVEQYGREMPIDTPYSCFVGQGQRRSVHFTLTYDRGKMKWFAEDLEKKESTARKWNAIWHNRILPDGNPEYRGTWDTIVPSRGLFEVYLDDDTFRYGTIEDVYGGAMLFGRRDGDRVVFTKRYAGNGVPAGGSGSDIRYEGLVKGDRIEGNFYLGDEPGVPFWMEAVR